MGRFTASFTLILLLISIFGFAFEVKQATPVEVRENGDCFVRVLPSVVDVDGMGQVFTVAVVIEEVSNVTGFDVQFSWDNTILNYVDHTPTVPIEDYPDPQPPSPYGGILHSPTLTLKDDVDTFAGTYWATFATLGGPQFHGNGTAFTMSFQVIYHEAYDVETILDITSAAIAGDPVPPPCQLHDGIVRIDGWSQEERIFINSDGSITPPTANITTADNVTYTFTDNNNASLSVLRDNIIVDGSGYTLQSDPIGALSGVYIGMRTNVTVKNMKIKDFDMCFGVGSSSHNTFINNDISSFGLAGFYMLDSHSNSISGNNITGNMYAFSFTHGASENRIFNNTIIDVSYCVSAGSGTFWSNVIYHNNFVNVDSPWLNDPGFSWDNGYPSGGNYWSHYTGIDSFSGVHQNETGSDGIGDTPLTLGSGNRDRYPFIMKDGWENHPFSIDSNATISNKIISPATLQFNVSGPSDSTGYINITMPKGLNTTAVKVKFDQIELIPPPLPIITSNGSHYQVYIEFTLSSHHVTIQYAIGDIAVTEVIVSRTVIGQGYSAIVNATLTNLGDYSTTVEVTSQANSSIFGDQTDMFIVNGASVLISFVWNTTDWSIGNYSVGVFTAPCDGEGNMSNNVQYYGKEVCVTIPGDVDADFDVDIYDVVEMCSCYGCEEGDPEYEVNCDIDCDGDIDIYDIVLMCGNYGEIY
jgi:parallel beta-helix repeat protein